MCLSWMGASHCHCTLVWRHATFCRLPTCSQHRHCLQGFSENVPGARPALLWQASSASADSGFCYFALYPTIHLAVLLSSRTLPRAKDGMAKWVRRRVTLCPASVCCKEVSEGPPMVAVTDRHESPALASAHPCTPAMPPTCRAQRLSDPAISSPTIAATCQPHLRTPNTQCKHATWQGGHAFKSPQLRLTAWRLGHGGWDKSLTLQAPVHATL